MDLEETTFQTEENASAKPWRGPCSWGVGKEDKRGPKTKAGTEKCIRKEERCPVNNPTRVLVNNLMGEERKGKKCGEGEDMIIEEELVRKISRSLADKKMLWHEHDQNKTIKLYLCKLIYILIKKPEAKCDCGSLANMRIYPLILGQTGSERLIVFF